MLHSELRCKDVSSLDWFAQDQTGVPVAAAPGETTLARETSVEEASMIKRKGRRGATKG